MSSVTTRRYQELRNMRIGYNKEGRLQEFVDHCSKLFSNDELGRWRVRPLFEALVDDGAELVNNHFAPDSAGGFRMSEAAGVVDTKLFANVQGQYLYNAVLKAYSMPELIGDMLVTVQQSIEKSEKVPGVIALGDQTEVVGEGNPYGRAVTGERWIETPDTIKRGLILDITKEAIFFDKTNQILAEAQRVGQSIAINRERRILDVVLGISTVYKKNGAAATATYGSDNTITSTPLVDWASLDAAYTKFAAMTDPDSGEPITMSPTALIVPPALLMTANRIRNATMTNYNTNNSAGTANRETRVDGGSLHSLFSIFSNAYVKERTSSDTTWFYAAPKEAFVYMENWPITVTSEGANSYLSFERDIVARFKASERGAAGVLERLGALKATA